MAASRLLSRLDLDRPLVAEKPWVRTLARAAAGKDGSHEANAMGNARVVVAGSDGLKGGKLGAGVRSVSSATLPTYDTAVAGTDNAAPRPAAGLTAQAETAVFRVSLRGVRALRFDAASRQALVRLPVNGLFEDFESALVAGVAKHLEKVAANAKGWKAGKLARMNAFLVKDIKVDWERRGCCGGYGEKLDEWNWQRMVALFAQRGWRDELQLQLEVN